MMININVNIFQMKSKPHGYERFNDFIANSFVAIGWPCVGDLSNVSKDEIRDRLEQTYNYKGQRLATYLGAVNAFVNTVKKGDLILISNHIDQVFVFEVGDYEYVEEYDNDDDGMCHQRKAKLLTVVHKVDLNQELQELLRHRGTITQFKYPYEKSGLDKLLGQVNEPDVNLNELVSKALNVLEKELQSKDSMTRITAAAEILRYAKEPK